MENLENVKDNLNQAREISESDQTQPSKSPYMQVELPNGYVDEAGNVHKSAYLREISGYEEDILAATKYNMLYKMQELLINCVEKIGDIPQTTPGWEKIVKGLTVGDRIFLILKLRILTLGEKLQFHVDCPHCGNGSNQTVNLNDFKFIPMKNASKRTWEGVLPNSERKYVLKAQTGYEEEKLQEIDRTSVDLLSLVLLTRMVSLDGQAPVTLEMVKKLSMPHRQYLRHEIKNREGEVENEVDVPCPHCSKEFKTEIDLSHRNFFFPSAM